MGGGDGYLSCLVNLRTYACLFYLQVTVIMEIMLRKCGSAAVGSVTPEKYKSFLKTVVEVILHFLFGLFFFLDFSVFEREREDLFKQLNDRNRARS